MNFDPDKPCLRKSLDITPVEHEGQRMYAVRDPLGLAGEPIVVPGPVLFLMSLMNGATSIMDMQVAFTKRFGDLIMTDTINSIVRDMAERGYIESPDVRDKLGAVEDAYRKADVREAYHSGQAYPCEEKELRELLDKALEDVGADAENAGADAENAGADAENAGADAEDAGDRPPPRGLVAPHIDLGRGLSIYGRAYAELAGTRPPHTAVLFGTGHMADGNTYILTPMDFATPLGRAAADMEFCDRLVRDCGFDIRKGELAHRTEHSIEFQVLFLQHLFGAETPRIVPILCTAFEGEQGAQVLADDPGNLEQVRGFLSALRGAADACPGDVLLVAGADMCHVGPRFDQSRPLKEKALARIRKEDNRILEAGAADGAEAFYREVLRVENRNNICSVVSIYTVLKFLEGEKGSLLGYDMAAEPDGSAAVGFAALRIG